MKDPYVFDFLTLHKEYLEKDLEDGLVKHIQKFLIELGQGFAFVGQQYPLKAGEHDLYIDLLFYHLKLGCYVIVELKAGKFDSRDAGQMSAYLSAVDDQLRCAGDQPSIGIILCKTKDNRPLSKLILLPPDCRFPQLGCRAEGFGKEFDMLFTISLNDFPQMNSRCTA